MKWSDLRYVLDIKEDCKWPGDATSLKEIVAKLRQVDVLISQGQSMTDAVRATVPTLASSTAAEDLPPPGRLAS